MQAQRDLDHLAACHLRTGEHRDLDTAEAAFGPVAIED
jgi:hypothetical protein